MDLILWRHAEAEQNSLEDVALDLARRLTPHGEHQAQRMATWMESRLPAGTRIMCSPAVRCESTVAFLGRKYTVTNDLAPVSELQNLLKLVNWPDRKSPLLLVGHQPALGQLVAHLIEASAQQTAIRKGALWWLKSRERNGKAQIVTHCVIAPELL